MKAAVIYEYGDGAPSIAEVPTPTPKKGEVQIKVFASTVQTGDWRIKSLRVPRGMSLPLKLIFGFAKPKNPIFGTEVSGEISAIGEGVSQFKVGDQVVAITGMGLGGHGEFLVLPETAAIAAKPSNLSHAEAASLPFGLTTAWDFLVVKAALKPKEQVLVYGASGATGTALIQVAKLHGAEVTAVCSKANFPLVKSLGADHTIDYQEEYAVAEPSRYDVICDAVGLLDSSARSALKDKGRLILLSASLGELLGAPLRNLLASFSSGKTIIGGVADDSATMLGRVIQLAEQGKVKPVVDRVYPLAEIAEAYAHVAGRHKRGNVVIEVAEPARERVAK